MKELPLISIILSVYNSEKHLAACINSVLSQRYPNFELIIVDDCSADNSQRIIKEYEDPRIIKLKNDRNIGLAGSLNKAIKIVRGEYIARMDADDICMKKRFVFQINFLEKRKDVDICGGFITRIDANGKIIKKVSKVPTLNNKIKARTIFSPQFFHPTVVFRAGFIKKNGIFYNEDFKKSQDFELWSRFIFKDEVTFANVPKRLIYYRDESNKEKKRLKNEFQTQMANIVREQNLKSLNIPYEQSFSVIHKFINEDKLTKFEFYRLVILLKRINSKSGDIFSNYPKLNNLFPLNLVRGIPIIFFITKGLYRNLILTKRIKQVFRFGNC